MSKAIDRTWAERLSEEEFTREYVRRFPHSDAIPTREDYVASKADEMEVLVFPTTEQYERDTAPEEKHLSESDVATVEAGLIAQGEIFCTDCPTRRTFVSEKALAIHRGIAHKGLAA